jgi:hypothetical protein
MEWNEMDSSGSGWCPVECSLEDSNEILNSIKYLAFLIGCSVGCLSRRILPRGIS